MIIQLSGHILIKTAPLEHLLVLEEMQKMSYFPSHKSA